MVEGYVGLNIGGDGTEDAPACPDCGGTMEPLPFRVEADDEETAARVFAAYLATRNIPVEVLAAIADKKLHVHVADGSGADCKQHGDGGA